MPAMGHDHDLADAGLAQQGSGEHGVFPGRSRLFLGPFDGDAEFRLERGFHQRALGAVLVGGATAGDRNRQLQLAIGVGGEHQPLVGLRSEPVGNIGAVPRAHLAAEHDDRLRTGEIDLLRHAGLGPPQQP